MDRLPREIVLHILHNVDPQTLCAVGSTCRHLHELTMCDSLWAQHCHQYGVHEFNPNADHGLRSYRAIYSRLLHQYGWMLGIWQGDQTYYGSLLIVQWHPVLSLICASLLEPTAPMYRLRPWLGDAEVMILEQHRHKVLAKLGFSIRLTVDGLTVLSLDFLNGSNPHSLDLQLAPCEMQPHPDCPSLWNHDAYDSQINHTLVDQAAAFSLRIEQPARNLHLTFKFAKLANDTLFPPKESSIPVGLFASFYGGHGLEYVCLQHNEDRQELRAVKVTGDPNIPRSEITWVAFVGNQIRQCADSDFFGSPVYEALGHVAFHGFQNASLIDCELFIVSHDNLAVYWPELRQITVYHRCRYEDFQQVLLTEPEHSYAASAYG